MTTTKQDKEKKLVIEVMKDDPDFNIGLFLDKAKDGNVKEVTVIYNNNHRIAGELLVSTLTLSAGYKLINSTCETYEITDALTKEKKTRYRHTKVLKKEWLDLKEKLEQRGIKP